MKIPDTKLSKKEKIGALFAAAFILLVFLDRMAVSPIANKIQQINREVKLNERGLSVALRNLSQKESISRDYQKYAAYQEAAGSDEEKIAVVLREIEGLAQKSGLRLANTKPHQPKKIDSHKEYSVEIETEAEMGPLVDFLHRLNASSQLLRVEKLRLNLKDKNSSIIKASILITKISSL